MTRKYNWEIENYNFWYFYTIAYNFNEAYDLCDHLLLSMTSY